MGLLDFLKPVVCPLELQQNGDLLKQLEGVKEELDLTAKALAQSNAVALDLNNSLNVAKTEMVRLAADNAALLIENLELEAKCVEPPSAYPTWMKPSMDVYEPSTTVVRPDGFRDSIHIPMRFFYPRFDDLWELVVSKGWLAMEPLEKRINEVFKWVVLNHAYQYDLGEDWRNAQETFYYKKGDCEDSTILFVTLCRLAAIPADRVFNAIGSFNGTGHSFGIARHDDNRLYLYETTLSSPPSSIKAYDGNGPYKIDCLSNWKYVGVLK